MATRNARHAIQERELRTAEIVHLASTIPSRYIRELDRHALIRSMDNVIDTEAAVDAARHDLGQAVERLKAAVQERDLAVQGLHQLLAVCDASVV
jgi:hypothetical protein